MYSLLSLVQNLISRLLDLRAPRADPYIIGDRGYDRFYGSAEIITRVGAAGLEPRVLLRSGVEDQIRLSIYFPDLLIAQLEAENPLRTLHDRNVDAFLCFVEELDHFALICHKGAAGHRFSLLELELHANVTKFFITRYFLKRQNRGPLRPEHQLWLDFHLFHKRDYNQPDPGLRTRYLDASRLGLRFVRHLMAQPPPRRLRELRRWSRSSPQQKVRTIERLSVH